MRTAVWWWRLTLTPLTCVSWRSRGTPLPGTVEVTVPVSWDDVAALLVDDVEAESDVRLARTGDEEAFERAADADLLWFDVSERGHLASQLG